MTKNCAILGVLAALAAPALAPVASGDYITDSFGAKNCSRPDTMSFDSDENLGQVVTFDLSGIKDAPIHRAILIVRLKRTDYRQPVAFYPVQEGKPPHRGKEPLATRPPFFQDLDATDAVRASAKSGRVQFVAASAPGWVRAETQLLVSYTGKARQANPPVTGLEALFDNGQVFLRWKEVADVIAQDQVKYGDFEEKVLNARKERHLVYRVYRHAKPITVENLGEAELVRTVEEIIPAYNLDNVPTTEFPGSDSKPSRLGIGGNRVQSHVVPRFLLPGDKPLVCGQDLAVITSRQAGNFHYAVTPVINGCEAVAALDAGSSLAEPVAEKVQAIGPVLQRKEEKKPERGGSEVWEYYVCFYEPPYSSAPLRVEMVSTYNPKSLEGGRKVPLEFCTGIYGGQAPYNLGRRCVSGGVYIAPPITGPMWQGTYECLGTLRSFGDSLIRNYPHKQVLDLIEWAKTKWPIDEERICINGQFALWALRHGDVFALVDADPYGNYSAGVEMQKQSWAWPDGAKNEDGGVDQWEYLDLARWMRENPTKELPFYTAHPAGATHVGDMGFMQCPDTYRALVDSKRAFAGRWGHSLGTGAPPAAGFPFRKSLPLPAFGNCSLDDCIGEGDQWGGAGGGTIGSGDPFGQMNAFLCWDFDDIVDEPDRFEITVWLDKGAPRPACTVDLTPRRCRKFKPTPGAKMTWTVAPATGGETRSGELTVDKNGLATAGRLPVALEKARIKIAAE